MTNWSKISKFENGEMNGLLEAVHDSIGIDFSDYAQASLQRRIIRFNDIARLNDIDELIYKIKFESGFAAHFINEITVNVSEMFRDPTFWKIIRDLVLPELSRKSVINIWHAGCSMGEEVFTMAIMLKEAGLLAKSRLTATDININALNIARSGLSLLKNQEVNSLNYQNYGGTCKLEDYFTVADNKVGFNKELLRKLEFKKHDLSTNGHFGMFDLIICRNVFIYFNSDLQEKVLAVFNQSMVKDSFLGIGSKESIAYCRGAGNLRSVSVEEKIFRRI
jgi:chemotaxis protein methyltransferase CheR